MGYCLYEMPDGKKELINVDDVNIDIIIDLVRRYVNDEIGIMLKNYIDSLSYEGLKFNSDFEVYEAENESFRDALNEIDSILQQYEDKLERGDEKFSRKRALSLFEDIHMIIDSEI